MTPPVSVVVATFNHGRFVTDAIDSALGQTLAGVEVVVVDDGSTDATPTILARYGDRIRVVRQANRGLAAARNRGLAVARGTYIGFLDADDVVAPTKLTEQAGVLDESPRVGWTYCDVLIEDETSGTTVTASAQFAYRGRRLDGRLLPELIRGNFIPAIAPLVRRSALDAAGRFDERLTALEDWDLWLRLALVAEARYVPRVLATYRLRAGGMSRDRTRMDENRFRVLDGFIRSHPDTVESLGAAGRRVVADTHNWFGFEAYRRSDWAEATRRLRASVGAWPLQRRAAALLGLCLLRGRFG